jgi:hypothetical protein
VVNGVVHRLTARRGLRTVRGVTHGPGEGRWHRLFADLEAEAEAAERASLRAEVAERARIEAGRLRFTGRLRAAVGHSLRCDLLGAGSVAGTLREVGPDWLLLAEPAGAEVVVPLDAVGAVTGLGPYSAPPGTEGAVGARLDLRYALRRLARERAPVTVVLADGTALAGTLDRVGADFLELAEHAVGEARRLRAVRQMRVIPLRALGLLRSAR